MNFSRQIWGEFGRIPASTCLVALSSVYGISMKHVGSLMENPLTEKRKVIMGVIHSRLVDSAFSIQLPFTLEQIGKLLKILESTPSYFIAQKVYVLMSVLVIPR